jgi:CIC family chloride channel protein
MVEREGTQNLLVMCLLAVAVGVIAGVGAWVFRLLIGLFHNILFLGTFAFHYDANVHSPPSPWGVGVIAVPVIGALLVAWLVKTFAPEAKGHGVPEVMDAIYYNGGVIRPVVAVVKSLASALCLGSGGSVGREGPIIQIGSAFGSTLGQILKIPTRQRVTLIAAGAGGGIAATFNAPLGGLVFAIELLLVSVNFRNLLPVGLATVVASYIGRALIGTHPAFDFQGLQIADFHLTSPWLLLLFVPFGVLIGLVATLFIRGLYWAEDRFDSMPGNAYTRHVSGMAVVGVMIYLVQRQTGHYYVQGVGYATIMDLITGVLTDPVLLASLFVLKLLATGLTLGSGGSGGVFSPTLFLGATAGGIFGFAVQRIFPGLPVQSAAFVIAGMAASIGASTGALVTGSVMLMEMTYDRNVTLPIIVTSVVAYGVRKCLSSASVYTLKLNRRGHVVPEGLQAALAEAYRIVDIAEKQWQVIEADQSADCHDGIAIVTAEGGIIGVAEGSADASTSAEFILATECASMIDSIRKMRAAGAHYIVVVNKEGSRDPADIVGVVTPGSIAGFVHISVELL